MRVLLADDHTLFRKGLASLLLKQPDVEVVGEAGDGWQCLDLAKETSPDIVLMDITMPGLSGIEATRQIKQILPETRVLLLTIHDREDYLFAGLQAGASGYLLKGVDLPELMTALRTVYEGEIFIYPNMTTKLVKDYLRRAEKGEGKEIFESLTSREKEVLQLLAEGNTNAEIGRILFISSNTVQTHRDHVMKKLDIHSRAELMKYALRKGVIRLDP
jgi:two-component system response regulator NreC